MMGISRNLEEQAPLEYTWVRFSGYMPDIQFMLVIDLFVAVHSTHKNNRLAVLFDMFEVE